MSLENLSRDNDSSNFLSWISPAKQKQKVFKKID